MNPVQFADHLLDAAALGLKAALTWPRSETWGNFALPATRRNYASDIGQGLSSTVVLPVIMWLARSFIMAPCAVDTVSAGKGGKVQRTPMLPGDTGAGYMLTLLKRPNPYYSGKLLQRAAVIDYITTGNAYVYKRRGAGGRVGELWWLPQLYTRARWPVDGAEYISHYEYNPNGNPMKIPPEDIIHLRDGLDPRDGRHGFSRLAALAREIYTDEEASAFSATILTNLGVPGVVISPAKGQTTATGLSVGGGQVRHSPESIKTKFKEEFSGDNRGAVMVMTAPTDVSVLSFSPQQLTLKDLRRIPEERVSGVFGVAAIVAGLGAGLDRSTFANFAEARAASYEEATIPTQDQIADEWALQLLPEFADPARHEVYYDLSNVRVLQENQDAIWKRASMALNEGGITRRRFKELIGEEPDDTNDNVYYQRNTTIVVNGDQPPPPIDTFEEPEAPTDEIDALLGLPTVEPGTRNGNGKRTEVLA